MRKFIIILIIMCSSVMSAESRIKKALTLLKEESKKTKDQDRKEDLKVIITSLKRLSIVRKKEDSSVIIIIDSGDYKIEVGDTSSGSPIYTNRDYGVKETTLKDHQLLKLPVKIKKVVSSYKIASKRGGTVYLAVLSTSYQGEALLKKGWSHSKEIFTTTKTEFDLYERKFKKKEIIKIIAGKNINPIVIAKEITLKKL